MNDETCMYTDSRVQPNLIVKMPFPTIVAYAVSFDHTSCSLLFDLQSTLLETVLAIAILKCPLTLYQMTTFYPKLKAHAVNKINVTELIFVSGRLLKTFWEKEKMLVTSIFSFSQNVFKSLLPRVVKCRDCVVKG